MTFLCLFVFVQLIIYPASRKLLQSFTNIPV